MNMRPLQLTRGSKNPIGYSHRDCQLGFGQWVFMVKCFYLSVEAFVVGFSSVLKERVGEPSQFEGRSDS